ncbi:hypothetical protein PVAG01_06349 [Phlyctema vagabunda]|uniref:Metallo-beta-lactamase domain-containing protein n=1 Tax=Phlyctema vagabunda TaxID=108571 RepID=A0ABR4PFT9_9HELO
MAHSATTSFVSRRVNQTTFMIIEDDAFGEQPNIFVKLYASCLLITDTGCNTPRRKNLDVTNLRDFLEQCPVPANENKPLNPKGSKRYVIICSHCHYDHILGIPPFLSTNPTIIASAFGKSYILDDLPSHSLCKSINVPTPKYNVSYWAEQHSYLPHTPEGKPFRIQFLNIPGHTPCSLAWYDIDERHLYVGDTFYERKRAVPIPELPSDSGPVPGLPATNAAIIFDNLGGNWIQYMSSLELLLSFTQHQNSHLRQQYDLASSGKVERVLVGSGHLTSAADAEEMILQVQQLFRKIISGELQKSHSGVKAGVIYDFWTEGDDARYSVIAPRRLREEARRHFKN